MKNIETPNGTKHIVAYLDILGVEDSLSDNQNKIINTLNFICEITNKNINTLNQMEIFPKIKKHMFSDNIVFAQEIEGGVNEIQVFNFLLFISLFLHNSLQNGVLVRGGITIGELFINENFVLGNALVRAYKLESQIAIYPRIVLDFDVFGWLSLIQLKEFSIPVGEDMIFYIDACHIIYKPKEKAINYQKIKEAILKTCKYKQDLRIVQKHLWLMSRFNEYCDLNNKPEFKINITKEYADIPQLVLA